MTLYVMYVMHVCMYVCMCVYMCLCIYVCAYAKDVSESPLITDVFVYYKGGIEMWNPLPEKAT